MSTIKAAPQDFAMWHGPRLLAEARLDQSLSTQLADNEYEALHQYKAALGISSDAEAVRTLFHQWLYSIPSLFGNFRPMRRRARRSLPSSRRFSLVARRRACSQN